MTSASERTPSLRNQTAFGSLWTLTGQGLRFATTLSTTAILARVLTPEDFGLVAMAMVAVSLVAMVQDFGLGMAAIQASTLSEEEASSLFWLNLGLGGVLSFLILALSPVVAWVYGDPRITPVLAWLGLSFALTGMSVQHAARLRRAMAFGRLTMAEYAGILTGSIAGIVVALYYRSYWALVIQTLCIQGSTALYFFVANGWVPLWPKGNVSIRRFLAFGGKLSGSNICIFLIRNTDNFLIGKYAGPGALGVYSKAYQILLLPIQQINAPLTSAFLPALSRLQDDPVRFRRWYLQGLGTIAMISTPLVVAMVLFAQEIVTVVLGSQWQGAVLIFLCLSPAALMGATNVATAWIYVPLGLTGRQLRFSVIHVCIALPLMIAALPWGAVGMACAVSATQVLLRVPGLLYCYRGTSFRLADYFQSVLPPFGVSMVAAAAAWWFKDRLAATSPVMIVLAGCLYAGLVAAGYLLTPSIRTRFRLFLELIRKR